MRGFFEAGGDPESVADDGNDSCNRFIVRGVRRGALLSALGV